MELRRERYFSELLDPRRNFERTRAPVEVRWDPLTGQSCRLLPEGSIPPPERYDLQRLADETASDCPFCRGALASATPRFPPEVWADGHICCGEAVAFPNLVPYAKWSSVSIYSPDRHLLPIEEITPRLLADNLLTQTRFASAVCAYDAAAAWTSISANHLPPSGSSIFHPHLQGSANPVPTTFQRLLAEQPPTAIRDYVALEKRDGERYIGATGQAEWVASFAPSGPAEIRGFCFGCSSPVDLSEESVEDIARGIPLALKVYAGLGFQSFNLAIYGAPARTAANVLTVRLVARAYFGALGRSDAMWSERLHAEGATDLAPESVAAVARAKTATYAD